MQLVVGKVATLLIEDGIIRNLKTPPNLKLLSHQERTGRSVEAKVGTAAGEFDLLKLHPAAATGIRPRPIMADHGTAKGLRRLIRVNPLPSTCDFAPAAVRRLLAAAF